MQLTGFQIWYWNIICWIGWSIDTYIGTVGTLFVLPCSLFIVISFGARAWGIVWARLAVLSCYFVVVPSTTLGFEPRTSSRLYTSEHCRNHRRTTRKRLSGRYRQSRRARVDVAGDNKITLPTAEVMMRTVIEGVRRDIQAQIEQNCADALRREQEAQSKITEISKQLQNLTDQLNKF